MNDGLARYLYLPWLRQGLATKALDPSPYTTHRASLTVSLQINQKSNERIQKPVELYGPGDVTGFSSRAVVRTDPKPNIGDFEPNYFPLIEFFEPDFPWRYTPLSIAENEPQLQPWICLIVLRAEDGAAGAKREFQPHVAAANQQPASARGQDPNRRLPPAIQVLDPQNSLPDLRQSWAWAHAQVAASDEDAGNLQELVRDQPERVVSRLLCPRRLAPGVLYHAFVVPTFKSGLLAGLGQDPGQAAKDDLAWDLSTPAGDPMLIPYYFDWQFRTGLRGDFESLVRLLEPRELDRDSGVGKRDMDCADPGYDLPGVERTDKPEADPRRQVVALEGALTTVDAKPDPPTDVDGVLGQFGNGLTALLNRHQQQLENALDRTLVVPPIYGRWHAARDRLLTSDRAWLDDLNLDPRTRASAAFGTLVVQEQQEKLMAEAWRQIGAVNEANELLRQAQLGAAVSERTHRRHLGRLARADLIRLTGPVHTRALIDSPTSDSPGRRVTVRQLLLGDRSRIPPAVLDPAFRRVFRPRGPLRLAHQQSDARTDRPDILDRLNEGDVAPVGPPPSPDGAPGMGGISDGGRPPWGAGPLWQLLKQLHWVLLVLILILYLLIALLAASGVSISPTNPLALAAALLLLILSIISRRFITPGLISDQVQEEAMTADAVRGAPQRPDFAFEDVPGSDFSLGSTGGQDSEAAAAFRQFAIHVQSLLSPEREKELEPEPVDLENVRVTLLDALDPKKTIVTRTKQRLSIRGVLRGGEGLEPIMAAPEFHQPMYEPLRDLSQELLLPGVGNIPQNTITILQTNRRFIEAYMVGLNHEMARELLWREYPTDQRGSYFRQFWDVSDFVPPASMLRELEAEASQELGEEWDALSSEQKEAEVDSRLRQRLKDIPSVHGWLDTSLGQNGRRQSASGEEDPVLLIRGDLLKKYPTTVIYAARARWDQDKDTRWPIFDAGEQDRREPVLGGTLPPDITFLGFALRPEEAKGTPGEPKPDAENQGWFFVIEERIFETRFGMDAPPADPSKHRFKTWDDLSWSDVERTPGGVQASGYVNVGAAPTPASNPDDYRWDSDAATVARITVQKPVRVAVHAADMLPD